MSDALSGLRRVLIRDLEALGREIALFPDDATVWRTLPGVTNSAGNLALHLCGNLQHFVGAVLGKTGYVRDRDAEFTRKNVPGPEIAREIGKTIAVVSATLGRLAPGALSDMYPAAPNNIQVPTGLFLLHLAVHLTYHLGQANYLRRALTGSAASGGGVSIAGLA